MRNVKSQGRKSQKGQAKILHKKHVYNNCFSTRTIKKLNNVQFMKIWNF